MAREIPIGRTGSAEYTLRGMWVYRKVGAYPYKYDTLEGFVQELMAGALGGSWRETGGRHPHHRSLHKLINRPRRECCEHPRLRLSPEFSTMRTIENGTAYTPGAQALSILAGWTAPEPAPLSAADRWQIVAVALRSIGCTDPAPSRSTARRAER